jgi:DNA-binding NarL/FixJ family response regulator
MKRFSVVAEAGGAEEALSIATRLSVDLVIMDVRLPGIDGVEATRRLLKLSPDTIVILVSTYPASDLPSGLQTCGAAGFVPKEELTAGTILDLFNR